MSVLTLNDAEFESALQNNPKIVVKFYADWCGTCRLFAPKFKKMAELPEFQDIVFVEINAEKNPLARKMAQVNNLPFIATFKAGALLEGAPTGKEELVKEMLLKF